MKGLQGIYGDSWHYQAIRDTLVLRQKQSRVIVEPSAVGTGISQVFPVIAAAVAEKAQFVAVEQPELHIHPRMQCELGDVFITQMHRHDPELLTFTTYATDALGHTHFDEMVSGGPLADALPSVYRQADAILGEVLAGYVLCIFDAQVPQNFQAAPIRVVHEY